MNSIPTPCSSKVYFTPNVPIIPPIDSVHKYSSRSYKRLVITLHPKVSYRRRTSSPT